MRSRTSLSFNKIRLHAVEQVILLLQVYINKPIPYLLAYKSHQTANAGRSGSVLLVLLITPNEVYRSISASALCNGRSEFVLFAVELELEGSIHGIS